MGNGTILVTGGAGYIGSVAVKTLINKGYDVIVVDNLSKGKKELVDEKAKLYEIDLVDIDGLDKVFSENNIDAVIHFAAYKAVGESMENAVKYADNITGMSNLLKCMVKHDVKRIVYSSSAAVYGLPDETVIDEDVSLSPINFYGYTKKVGEEMLEWFHKVHGIQYVALRYFNVAGDVLGYIDPDAQNVFPILMEVIVGKRTEFVVFGDDYDTRDGTCIRDYVHVQDLIDAHVLALDVEGCEIINLGTGTGTSVKELVGAVKEVTGKDMPVKMGERREGDPGMLVASNGKAKEHLGWEPRFDIAEMIKSTYEAYEKE